MFGGRGRDDSGLPVNNFSYHSSVMRNETTARFESSKRRTTFSPSATKMPWRMC